MNRSTQAQGVIEIPNKQCQCGEKQFKISVSDCDNPRTLKLVKIWKITCVSCGWWVSARAERRARFPLAAITKTMEFVLSKDKKFFDFADHIEQQKAFSLATFGPGERSAGIIDHIKKELVEIKENPSDLEEWVDVATLGIDGVWRAGFSSDQIAKLILFELTTDLPTDTSIDTTIFTINSRIETVERYPRNLGTWILVVRSAIRGALILGFSLDQITQALTGKLEKNKKRTWPDWRTADKDKAIEHVRNGR